MLGHGKRGLFPALTHTSHGILKKSLLALQMCSAAASYDQITKVLKSFENLAIYFVAE